MTSTLFYCAAAALALAAGWRRSRYDGIPPWIWWREQRLHHRPGAIIARLGRALLAVALAVGSATAALLLLGAVLTGALCCAALAWAWWRLRCATRAAAPRLGPAEMSDVDPRLDDEPDPDSSPSALEM